MRLQTLHFDRCDLGPHTLLRACTQLLTKENDAQMHMPCYRRRWSHCRQQHPDLILYMWSHGRLKLPSECFFCHCQHSPPHSLWVSNLFGFSRTGEHSLSLLSLDLRCAPTTGALQEKRLCASVCAFPISARMSALRPCAPFTLIWKWTPEPPTPQKWNQNI